MSFVMGIVMCIAALAVIVMGGGSPAKLLDYNALLLVVGGMVGIIFITCPVRTFLQNVRTAARTMHSHVKSQKITAQIMELVQTARRSGVLALEGLENEVSDEILKKGLVLITDSADRETIESILLKEAENENDKEKAAQEFIERIAMMLPGIGMIGTLVEIVQMLYTYKGPQMLAPGIAKDLLPIVYSVIIAYLCLIPLAARVKAGSDMLKRQRELAVQGVLAIQAGEPPHIIEQRLLIYADGKEKNRR